MNEPIGRRGSLEAGSCPAHRVRDGLDRLVLADDPLVEPLLHVDELGLLALHEARDRDAGPRRDDARDVVRIDLLLEQPPRTFAVGGEGALALAEPFLELGDAAVPQLGGTTVVGRPLGDLDLVLRGLQLGLRLADRRDGLLLLLPLALQRARALGQVRELALERLEAGP